MKKRAASPSTAGEGKRTSTAAASTAAPATPTIADGETKETKTTSDVTTTTPTTTTTTPEPWRRLRQRTAATLPVASSSSSTSTTTAVTEDKREAPPAPPPLVRSVSAFGALAGAAALTRANRERQLVDMANAIPVYNHLCDCAPITHIPRAVLVVCAAYLVDHHDIGLYHERRGEWKEAFDDYKYAAVEGNAMASYKLGICQLWGFNTVPINQGAAVAALQIAADAGLPAAKSLLGDCYWEGAGVIRDMESAVQLWKARDDPYSKMWYGDWQFYAGNSKMAKQLWSEALPELKTAADAGDPRAQHELAGAYERGHGGLVRDRTLSRHYSLLAAIQGHAQAQNQCGLRRLQNGAAVPPPRSNSAAATAMYGTTGAPSDAMTEAMNLTALVWFQRASAQHLCDAAINCSRCYLRAQGGAGDEPDLGEALKCAMLAETYATTEDDAAEANNLAVSIQKLIAAQQRRAAAEAARAAMDANADGGQGGDAAAPAAPGGGEHTDDDDDEDDDDEERQRVDVILTSLLD